MEVALFDNAACLDRVNFVHLPSDANVSLTIPAPDICRIALSNFGQSSIEPQETGPDVKTTVTRNHVTIEVRTDREKHRLLRLRARWQNSETIFSVPMLTRKAGFYDPDGVPIPKNHWTLLTSLLGASAEAVERASALIASGDAMGPRGHITSTAFRAKLAVFADPRGHRTLVLDVRRSGCRGRSRRVARRHLCLDPLRSKVRSCLGVRSQRGGRVGSVQRRTSAVRRRGGGSGFGPAIPRF